MAETPDGEEEKYGDEREQRPGQEPVGNLAEEAARLVEALQDWARGRGGGFGGFGGFGGGPSPDWFGRGRKEPPAGDDVWAEATAPGSEEPHAHRGWEEHFATGAPECRSCPICQAVRFVRGASPATYERFAEAVDLIATGLREAARAAERRSGEQP